MHLRPPSTAARHGHPRGRPAQPSPVAPRGGRDSAARASRVRSCVGRARAGRGRAGSDRCARRRTRPDPLRAPRLCAPPRLRATPPARAPIADLEPRRSRSVAPGQWPPHQAPRPRPDSPAPSAPGPAARWRPSMRPRPCRAPCKAIGPRRPPPPPSLVMQAPATTTSPSPAGNLTGSTTGPLHHHQRQPCRSFFTHMLPLALRLPSGLPLYCPLRRQTVRPLGQKQPPAFAPALLLLLLAALA